MDIIHPERFEQLVTEAQAADFEGWDFCWLEGRLVQEEPPWHYPEIVRAHFASVHSLLDLGTGGGELLASLIPLPERRPSAIAAAGRHHLCHRGEAQPAFRRQSV